MNLPVAVLLIPLLLAVGCAASSRGAALQPAAIPLTQNHFQRDVPSGISEANLRQILEAPVFLAEGERLGVVPVGTLPMLAPGVVSLVVGAVLLGSSRAATLSL